MADWGRADVAAYRRMPLRAHSLLADVPVHDVWQVRLPGGGPGRSLADARAAFRVDELREIGPAVRFLFGLRRALGRWFRLERKPRGPGAVSYLGRLTAEDRKRSLVKPGSADGPFATIYVFPDEAVSEARNVTVHAFLVYTLQPEADGYLMTWAIHVAPVSWLTPIYMALIAPFRRFIVYPSLLRHIRRRWIATYGGAGGRPCSVAPGSRGSQGEPL